MTQAFMIVLDMSLKASFVIFTVCLIRWVFIFFQYPRRFCYLLWGIVLLRLLLPVSFTSPLSRLPDLFTGSIASDWADDYVGDTRIIHDVSPDFETAVEHGNSPVTTNMGGQYVITAKDGISSPKTVKTDILPILSGIWLIGLAAMVLWSLCALHRLRKQSAEAIPVKEQVWICDSIQTAYVIGLFRPRIYLPASLSDTEYRHILRHEQYHIRKHDHLWKLLGFTAVCLHWFNPLVWLAYRLAAIDMELRCDEAVTADLSENDKADYAQTLLDMTTGKRYFHIAPVAFGEGDTANRIRHIMSIRNTTKLAAALAVCLLIFTAVGMLTDPKEIRGDFGASMYGYERIAYADYGNSSSYAPPNSFCLTTDNQFWVMDSQYGWENPGVADLYTVTAEEINDMMPYRLAMERPPVITKVTDAKIIRFKDDNGQHLFYLLTRHKDGRYYVAYGHSASPFYEPDRMTIRTLFPVNSGVGSMSSNGPFYQRCLESMLDDAVDVFSTHSVGKLKDGWQIVGFRMGVPKTTYGWALFRIRDDMAEFSGQMQLFENAADTNNGILLSSPAVCSENGEITDKTAYDVVLITNPHIAEMRIHTTPPSDMGATEIRFPDMVTISWETIKDYNSIGMTFYDAEGNMIPDDETEQIMQRLLNLEKAVRDTTQGDIHFALGRIGHMTDLAEEYLADPIEAAKTELPAGIEDISVFHGEHDIVQFSLQSFGTRYRGYYYSPDDVPVSFQNAEIPLTETEEGWAWHAEGDNRGTTKRITKCWFSYEATL